mgnify:CR=1 FL=1
MFYFHKKHLLIGLLITLDILLLADIADKKIVQKPQGEVAGTRIVKRKAIPTKIPKKITLTPTPSPKSIWIASTSVPKISGNTNSGLLKQINDFRLSKGKSALSEEPTTCSFASLRAGEIVSNFTHDGFRNRVDSKTLPYPGYSSVAENIAYNGDSLQVVPGWISSSGHAENILRDVPYGCVGNSGIYYVFEAWKP